MARRVAEGALLALEQELAGVRVDRPAGLLAGAIVRADPAILHAVGVVLADLGLDAAQLRILDLGIAHPLFAGEPLAEVLNALARPLQAKEARDALPAIVAGVGVDALPVDAHSAVASRAVDPVAEVRGDLAALAALGIDAALGVDPAFGAAAQAAIPRLAAALAVFSADGFPGGARDTSGALVAAQSEQRRQNSGGHVGGKDETHRRLQGGAKVEQRS